MTMTKAYPFNAVLFDLDGVLIDTTDLHYRIWDEFARSKGLVPSRPQLLATNGRRADETIRLWLGDELSDYQIAALTAERETFFNRLLETEVVPAVAGAVEFVRELVRAGVPIGVATSATPENARLAIAKIGLADAICAIVTAGDVSNGKPHPEPYIKLAAALGTAAADCVAIEDSVSGIRSAKAAGAKCLAVTTTFPESQRIAESPDWVVAGFEHLPPALRPTG
jgi:HAD superfamily hydrolase (TIGR01509 family)